MRSELYVDEFGVGLAERDLDGRRPRPLSFWRVYLETSGGVVPGVDGEIVPVSLDRWADADENTLLDIYVRFVDPELVGTIDPDFVPPADE